jgi:hypothetical protein
MFFRANRGARDMATRKSPAASATKHAAGARRKGLDGRMWVVAITRTGVHRWQPAVRRAAPSKLRRTAPGKTRRTTPGKPPRPHTAPSKPIRRRAPVREGSGKKFTDIAVRRSTGWEDNRGSRVKPVWVHISPGYVYLSLQTWRSYWVLSKIAPRARPRLSFSPRTNTMTIGSYRIRFARPQDLAFAQKCLGPYTRR